MELQTCEAVPGFLKCDFSGEENSGHPACTECILPTEFSLAPCGIFLKEWLYTPRDTQQLKHL